MSNSPAGSLRDEPSTTECRAEDAGLRLPPPSHGDLAMHEIAHPRQSPSISLSEEVAAIEALRKSEARFRMLADNMSQLAWTCDLLGNVTWYNKRWLDYTGLTFEEMQGWGWGKVQHPDHVDRVVSRVKRSAETGEPWEDVFPLRGKNGDYRWFLSRALPMRDERGNFVQWFGTNTDITEQVVAEEKVARQARELQALNERLHDLDRAKTAFFANVSHEFRTPLTLMLAPLEDALAEADALPAAQRQRLELAHRNSQRLLKLVNTLLDFSRLEAGRIQASYEETDLAGLTADLASNFRSACEAAGLQLIVDCPPLRNSQQVYVDRDMWEKIVLNLMSNAFKFTLVGQVEVRLEAIDGQARLTVRDTGVGIPSEELPHIFERFHRVGQCRGRTHEGSGIGLALVQDLVKLHGGTVRVDSALGEGSSFTVAIPFGTAHLDQPRIGKSSDLASTAIGSSAFVEEARRWLPGGAGKGAQKTFDPSIAACDPDIAAVQPKVRRARIVWAEDNADMREYVSRLLSARGCFEVEAVPDGQAALEIARANPPDLILSDVMMPRLDGCGLLRALRSDPELCGIPTILLSARAGEESRIEGMETGADDYLIKPFSARELLARVETHVKMSEIRRQATRQLHESEERLRNLNAELNARVAELQTARRAAFNIMQDANEARARVETLNVQLHKEIAERKRAEQAIRHTASIVHGSQDAIVSMDLKGIVTSWNDGAERLYGYSSEEMIGNSVTILVPEDRPNEEREILERIRRGESIEHYEVIRRRKDGSSVAISLTVSAVKDENGRIVGASKIARDISERRQAQERQELLNRELQHRTRNLFALVQAVVARSFAGKLSAKEAETAILSRLQSLAATHLMLVDQDWKGANLADVVRTEMEAYAGRVTIEGPKLSLRPKVAQNFALALHELATNAVKYGAFSNSTGRVNISWTVAQLNGAECFTFRWQELNGPPVRVPTRKGFGSTVLERVMAGQFEASPHIKYAASGISYELSGSLASITPDEQQWS